MLQALVIVSAFSTLWACISELKLLQSYSKAFAIWGLLVLGMIGSSSALVTAGFTLPDLTTSFIFAFSGLFLSMTMFNSQRGLALTKRANNKVPLLIYLVLATLTVVGLFNDSWGFPILMMVGYSPLLILALREFRLEDLKSAVFTGTALINVTLVALSTFTPERFFGECRLDKCSIWGVSIGSFSSGNALGLQLSAMGILALVFATKTSSKIILGLASGFLVDAAAGRTSLVAHIGTILLLISVRYIASTRVRKNILLVLVLLVSFVFALIPFNPQDFTFRGELWIYARNLIPDNLLFGHGASDWVRSAYSSGLFLNYSTHNLWLESLYVSGLLGFVVLLISLTVSSKLWGTDLFHPQVGLFFWLILSGLTEVPAYFARPYIAPSILLIFMLSTMASDDFSRNKMSVAIPRRLESL